MTPGQFEDLILDLPFDATNIINLDRVMHGQGTLKESGHLSFRKGRLLL